MSATFEFTPKPSTSNYTIAELNALFARIKTCIDGKVDAATLSATGPVLINGQPIINLKPAEAGADLITFGQLKSRVLSPFATLPVALHRFHAKMIALRDLKSSRVDVVAIGPSTTEGYYTDNGVKEDRWTEILARNVRALYGLPETGSTWKAAMYNVPTYVEDWVRTSGSFVEHQQFGGGRKALGLFNGAITTLTFTGTDLDLYYTETASTSTLRYRIDGGGPTDIDTQSPAGGGVYIDRKHEITGLTPGEHTITVEAVASGGGAGIVFSGAYVYNGDKTVGFHVHNLGHGGYRTLDWNTARVTCDISNALSERNADLVILAGMGANDRNQPASTGKRRTLAQFEVDLSVMTKWVRQIKPDADILIEQHYEIDPFDGATNVEPWDDWVDMVEEVAEKYGCAVFNTNDVIGRINEPGNPYSAGDAAHDNSLGYAAVASVLQGVVVPNPALRQSGTPTAPIALAMSQDFTTWAETDSAGGAGVCSAVIQGYTLSDATPVYKLTSVDATKSVGRRFALPPLTGGRTYRFQCHFNFRNMTGVKAFSPSILLNAASWGNIFTLAGINAYFEFIVGGSFGVEFTEGDRNAGQCCISSLHADFRRISFEFKPLSNTTTASIFLSPDPGAGSGVGSVDVAKPEIFLLPGD